MSTKKFQIQTPIKAVVIGGSAGSFQPVTKILSEIPKDFSIPIFFCLHRLKHVRHGFVEALSIKSKKEIWEPGDKESIRKGGVYLAPANYHMSLELGNTISLSTEDLYNNSRPAIDLLFDTASYVYREKVVAILLSGANKDGAYGMEKVNQRKGISVVQNPDESTINAMPNAAIERTPIDYVLNVDEIIALILSLDKMLQE